MVFTTEAINCFLKTLASTQISWILPRRIHYMWNVLVLKKQRKFWVGWVTSWAVDIVVVLEQTLKWLDISHPAQPSANVSFYQCRILNTTPKLCLYWWHWASHHWSAPPGSTPGFPQGSCLAAAAASAAFRKPCLLSLSQTTLNIFAVITFLCAAQLLPWSRDCILQNCVGGGNIFKSKSLNAVHKWTHILSLQFFILWVNTWKGHHPPPLLLINCLASLWFIGEGVCVLLALQSKSTSSVDMKVLLFHWATNSNWFACNADNHNSSLDAFVLYIVARFNI